MRATPRHGNVEGKRSVVARGEPPSAFWGPVRLQINGSYLRSGTNTIGVAPRQTFDNIRCVQCNDVTGCLSARCAVCGTRSRCTSTCTYTYTSRPPTTCTCTREEARNKSHQAGVSARLRLLLSAAVAIGAVSVGGLAATTTCGRRPRTATFPACDQPTDRPTVRAKLPNVHFQKKPVRARSDDQRRLVANAAAISSEVRA